jgi:hypothetical protein
MSGTLRENLIREARRIEEDALLSSKGHYAAAERWRNAHLYTGVPTTALTAIAGLVIVGGPEDFAGVPLDLVFGLVAIAAAISTGVTTFLGPEKQSTEHRAAGECYNALKGRARRFREIDALRPFSDADLSGRLDALVAERDGLNQYSPLIPNRAYEKAKRGIEAGEATYEADGAPQT